MAKISKRELKTSAGVVIVRQENGEYFFLMMRSGGYWEAGGKGKVEKGETEFEGALREVEEETTLTPDELDFKWGKIKYTTEPYTKNKKKIAIFYLAEVKRKEISIPFNPEIGKKEHDEYQWMTINQAKKVVNDRISKVLDWANEKYILNKDGSIQEEPDLLKWARWFETENRIIERTTFDKSGVMISTVFLGIDHKFGDDGPPLIFETMIFGGEHDQWQARASTIEESKRYHRHAIELARNII